MVNIGSMKLGIKFALLFMLVGLLPLIIFGFVSKQKATDALSNAAYQQLNSVREIKKDRIEQFLKIAKPIWRSWWIKSIKSEDPH